MQDLLADDTVLILPTFPSASGLHSEMFFRPADATYMMMVNAFGLPATQVPVGYTRQGLPIGIQVIGGPRMDRLTLDIAQEIENLILYQQ